MCSDEATDYISKEELLSLRKDSNANVVARIREHEKDDEVLRKAYEEHLKGWMAEPKLLTDDDMMHATLSRRIPLDEYSDCLQNPNGTVGGWRLRLVDHATESLVNTSTRCRQE